MTGPGKGKSTLAAAGSNLLDDQHAGGRGMPQRPSLLKKKTEVDNNKQGATLDQSLQNSK